MRSAAYGSGQSHGRLHPPLETFRLTRGYVLLFAFAASAIVWAGVGIVIEKVFLG